MIRNVYTAYFSPTGTSRKGIEAIAGVFGDAATALDLTRFDAVPEKMEFDEEDLVIFGAPVYGGRLYQGSCSRFHKLKGNKTPCIITVTYGNRAYEDALVELHDLVKEQGFLPIAAAALVGQHTYGTIQVGRPNEQDKEEDRSFACQVKEKLDREDFSEVSVPGNHPYRDGMQGGQGGKRFRPLTAKDLCIECGICAEVCPEGAIQSDDYSLIDHEKCISCFCCIRRCPAKAKNIDTEEYCSFTETFNTMLSVRKENEYFL